MAGFSQITLKGYEIVNKLGEGGFGTTYLVTPAGNKDKFYALKHFTFPNTDPGQYTIAQRLFRREVDILKTLNGHPQIPQFINYWEENQQHYLLQEFIYGKLLGEELEQGKKSENYIIKFLKEILLILQFVHQKQIIHRDINPNNIIRRDSDNKLFLIDFGAGAIKKIVKSTKSTKLQTPPTRIYTLGYAPWEQTQGNPQFNSDIYALGMTAIQMLIDIEPQDLETDAEGEVIWRNFADVSDWLADILCKMVCYEYRERHTSVDEVLEELSTSSQSVNSTQILNVPNNSNSLQTESTRNQTDLLLICSLAFLSIMAILSAAGVLPLRFQRKPETQPSSIYVIENNG